MNCHQALFMYLIKKIEHYFRGSDWILMQFLFLWFSESNTIVLYNYNRESRRVVLGVPSLVSKIDRFSWPIGWVYHSFSACPRCACVSSQPASFPDYPLVPCWFSAESVIIWDAVCSTIVRQLVCSKHSARVTSEVVYRRPHTHRRIYPCLCRIFTIYSTIVSVPTLCETISIG